MVQRLIKIKLSCKALQSTAATLADCRSCYSVQLKWGMGSSASKGRHISLLLSCAQKDDRCCTVACRSDTALSLVTPGQT